MLLHPAERRGNGFTTIKVSAPHSGNWGGAEATVTRFRVRVRKMGEVRRFIGGQTFVCEVGDSNPRARTPVPRFGEVQKSTDVGISPACGHRAIAPSLSPCFLFASLSARVAFAESLLFHLSRWFRSSYEIHPTSFFENDRSGLGHAHVYPCLGAGSGWQGGAE